MILFSLFLFLIYFFLLSLYCTITACDSSRQFECEDQTCIDISLRCNGRTDCPQDNSDEQGCPRVQSKFIIHLLYSKLLCDKNLKHLPTYQERCLWFKIMEKLSFYLKYTICMFAPKTSGRLYIFYTNWCKLLMLHFKIPGAR